MCFVDVVIPVYNCQKYIEKAIKSVLNQTYKKIHLILVNDGSIDDSALICRKYESLDNRITYLEKENSGVSDARNLSLKYIKGEYILFLDADDWIDNNTIETCLKTFEKNSEIDVVFFNYIRETNGYSTNVYVSKYRNNSFLDKDETRNYLMRRMFGLDNNELKTPNDCHRLLPVAMKMYKTEIIKNNNLQFVSLDVIGTSEDGLFNIEYLEKAKGSFYLNEFFYHYRRDVPSSITRTIDTNIFVKWNNLYSKMEIYIRPEFYESFFNRKLVAIITYGMRVEKLNCLFKDKKRYIKEFYDLEYFKYEKKIKIKYFSTKWKVFFFLVKYRQITFLLWMLKFMNYLSRK